MSPLLQVWSSGCWKGNDFFSPRPTPVEGRPLKGALFKKMNTTMKLMKLIETQTL